MNEGKEVKQQPKRGRPKGKPKRPNKKIYYTSTNLKYKIERFVKAGYNVTLTETRRTQYISVKLHDKPYDLTIFKTDEIIKFEEMNLQRACKKEFKSNEDKIKEMTEEEAECKYNSFSSSLKDVYKDSGSMYSYDDISEIDLTKAYYYASLHLGYISREFFDRCMEIPKQQRLRLIGSIATRKTIWTYEAGNTEPVKVHVKEDKKLRLAWDNIVRYVDKAMNEVERFLGEDFLFYWVDGVYFRDYGHNAKKIQLIFQKYGFESTYEKLHRVDVVNKNGVVELDVYKGENGEIFKPFTVPMYNQKAYKFV